MSTAKDSKNLVIIKVSKNPDEKEIKGLMRTARAARKAREKPFIVCLLDGFNNDPRQLWDIPEAKPICQKLVSSGFIAELDVHALAELGALGSFEIWLLSEGKMREADCCSREHFETLLNSFEKRLMECNAASEKAIGAYQP